MKILYVCTHNRCRSILSEAITNHQAKGAIIAYSAGSQPVGKVHPLSLKYLEESGISTSGLASKSWDEFELNQPDLVFTVCDSAANESCPVWMGEVNVLHWPLKDPSKLKGSEVEIREAFLHTIEQIKNRVDALLALNLDQLGVTEREIAVKRLINDTDM